jgi:hypothetical protein
MVMKLFLFRRFLFFLVAVTLLSFTRPLFGASFSPERVQLGNIKEAVGGFFDIAEKTAEDVDNVNNLNLNGWEKRYKFVPEVEQDDLKKIFTDSKKLSTRATGFVEGFLARIKSGLRLAFTGLRGVVASFSEFSLAPIVPRSPRLEEGVVVFPSGGKKSDDRALARLKSTFSDEVIIVPDESGRTGIITPVFRDSADPSGKRYLGDDYVYLLVPVPGNE